MYCIDPKSIQITYTHKFKNFTILIIFTREQQTIEYEECGGVCCYILDKRSKTVVNKRTPTAA